MKIIYFDCFSGISGDMILGALIDLGLNLDYLKGELKKINLDGYELETFKVKKKGITATKVDIKIKESKHHHDEGRSYPTIVELIEKSFLSATIKEKSLRIFGRIASVEAKIHNVSLEKIHFHEVGAVDSLVDVVGGVIGLDFFSPGRIISSAINTGQGKVKTDHGVIPVPAPATLELLKGFPCYASQEKFELATPTGVAIITTLADHFGNIPEIKLKSVGYGAGTRDLGETPNLLRLIEGEIEGESRENLILLETTIDDLNPQIYELVMEKAFNLGALEVFYTPIHMKKNRPAINFSILIKDNDLNSILDLIFRETTTLGVRKTRIERYFLERKMVEVKTNWGVVRVKEGIKDGQVIKFSPEYADCKKISLDAGLPLKDVFAAVSQAYRGF